jgi:hypothetical protein
MSKPVGQQKPQSNATPVSRVQQVAVINNIKRRKARQ